MIYAGLCLLVAVALIYGLYDIHGPIRYTRGIKQPWLLYGSDGSVKVDFSHPRMRKRIIETCEAVERIGRAPR